MTGTSSCVGCKVITLLAGIGALNWGLVGIAQMDLVAKVFGEMTTGARVVYGIVGLAGLLTLLSFVACCPCRNKETCEKK